jgi:chromosome segregation ATPase
MRHPVASHALSRLLRYHFVFRSPETDEELHKLATDFDAQLEELTAKQTTLETQLSKTLRETTRKQQNLKKCTVELAHMQSTLSRQHTLVEKRATLLNTVSLEPNPLQLSGADTHEESVVEEARSQLTGERTAQRARIEELTQQHDAALADSERSLEETKTKLATLRERRRQIQLALVGVGVGERVQESS